MSHLLVILLLLFQICSDFCLPLVDNSLFRVWCDAKMYVAHMKNGPDNFLLQIVLFLFYFSNDNDHTFCYFLTCITIFGYSHKLEEALEIYMFYISEGSLYIKRGNQNSKHATLVVYFACNEFGSIF